MAAFSYQYQQPFLVDSTYFTNINTSLPSHLFHNHQELSLSNQETSCVDQNSKNSISNNQSPESSMVVDNLEKGEQVTQKVTSMEKKRRIRNKTSLSSPLSKVNLKQFFFTLFEYVFILFHVIDFVTLWYL